MRRLTKKAAGYLSISTAAAAVRTNRMGIASTADFEVFDKMEDVKFNGFNQKDSSGVNEYPQGGENNNSGNDAGRPFSSSPLSSASASSSSSTSASAAADNIIVIPMTVWTPQQHAFRNVLRSLRGAYYNDRARLFWARHFARVEFYKYEKFVGEGDVNESIRQEELLKKMLKEEEEAAAAKKSGDGKGSGMEGEEEDLGDLLGMGATSEEELLAQKELTDKAKSEEDELKRKAEELAAEERKNRARHISTSRAVGSLEAVNTYAQITYTYTPEKSSPSPQHQHLVNLANECASFIDKYMKLSVDRIVEHNEVMMKLSVADAKRFRKAYLLREEQHDSWCKQKIRQILDRRPMAPYPYC